MVTKLLILNVPPVTPTISKTVTKIWNDAHNQDGLRPDSITANLYANGQFVDSVVLSTANNWTGTISDLAQNANGQAIDYTWQEANVPDGYTADVNGNVITNTHTPATISMTVTKQWVDNDNQDGLRPDSIKVNLLANGQIVKTVILTADNNWTATIDGLAQKANGQDIVYTWQEANVPAGYESKVAGDVITNTHAPLTTKATVTKVWNDADNKDGLRPASVTINLLANGQVIRTVELNATNNWQAKFDDLMVYSHQGQRIVYTVEEANVPVGYQSAVSQDDLSFTVTNTHQPTMPTEPTTPVTPEQPDQPTKPTEPTTPVTPEQPSQPTTPTEPTTPVMPGQPVQPVTPVVPGQPNVPAPSVQPSQTVSQGQPQLPQTGNHDGLTLMALGLVLMSMTIYVGKQRD